MLHRLIHGRSGIVCDWGATVPTNSTGGYAPGCIFVHDDGAQGAQLYVNEGSYASCDFNLVPTAEGDNTLSGTNTISGALTLSGATAVSDDITVADDIDINFGTDADTALGFEATARVLRIETVAAYLRAHGLSDRFELKWVAGQRGKPGINADILDATEATRMVTDPDFEILGTHATSDDVTFNAEGGITLATDGADGDGVFLLPHLDANQSAWSQVTWGSDQETEWECVIKTGAAITTSIVWAGLKLTNTDVVITDADQAFFRYEDGVNTGKWQAVYSIAGTDVAADSGVTVAVSTVYHLKITIDSTRVPRFYINGALVKTGTALTTAKDFIPYICIEEDGASSSRTLGVRGQAISRKFA